MARNLDAASVSAHLVVVQYVGMVSRAIGCAHSCKEVVVCSMIQVIVPVIPGHSGSIAEQSSKI